MKYAFINPAWDEHDASYLSCRDGHLPLELAYTRQMLAQMGHDALLFDAHLDGLPLDKLRSRVAQFAPDVIVIATAPHAAFQRMAPPTLHTAQRTLAAVRDLCRSVVAVGTQATQTPFVTLERLAADVAVVGECEDALIDLALGKATASAGLITSAASTGSTPRLTDIAHLPALDWPESLLQLHAHHHRHHNRYPGGLGAEMEASRGCPITGHIDAPTASLYRRRPLTTVVTEIDNLLKHGVGYIFFVDEVFPPYRALLVACEERPFIFGVRTRLEIWPGEMLELLGRAGCVYLEVDMADPPNDAERGYGWIDRLDHARRTIPFVQANLHTAVEEHSEPLELWRRELLERGIWVNRRLPRFPTPGSVVYERLWGTPDAEAWERAGAYYFAIHPELQIEANPVAALSARSYS